MNEITQKIFMTALKYWGQNYKAYGFPWCAAFLNDIFTECGVKGTGSNMARSFLDIGEHISEPRPGDIMVFWRVEKDSPWGHAGLYVYEDADQYYILGGNQDNRVKIKPYLKSTLLGVRRLNDTENNATRERVAW